MSKPARKPSPAPTLGSRLILTFFALILVAGGALLVRGLWNSYRIAQSMDSWVPTQCVILSSYIEEERPDLNSAPVYRPVIEYNYINEDQSYQGKSIRRGKMDAPKGDKKTAEELIGSYKQGQAATCYVNPDNPAEAVLKKETKASVFALWFPALISVGGLGMIIGAWWPRRTADEDEDDDEGEPATSEAAAAKSGTQSAPGGGAGE